MKIYKQIHNHSLENFTELFFGILERQLAYRFRDRLESLTWSVLASKIYQNKSRLYDVLEDFDEDV